MSLINFRAQIADYFIKVGKPADLTSRKRGRPSLEDDEEELIFVICWHCLNGIYVTHICNLYEMSVTDNHFVYHHYATNQYRVHRDLLSSILSTPQGLCCKSATSQNALQMMLIS